MLTYNILSRALSQDSMRSSKTNGFKYIWRFFFFIGLQKYINIRPKRYIWKYEMIGNVSVCNAWIEILEVNSIIGLLSSTHRNYLLHLLCQKQIWQALELLQYQFQIQRWIHVELEFPLIPENGHENRFSIWSGTKISNKKTHQKIS